MTGREGAHAASNSRAQECGGEDALVEYSGDNLTGAGEGDDEWLLFDLERLLREGVTHIAVAVNIYSAGKSFQQLSGSFLRAVVAARGEKMWATAQTVQYVDLDEMKTAGRANAAVVATFFLDDLRRLLLPQKAVVAQQNRDMHKPEVAGMTQSLTTLAEAMRTRGLSSQEQQEFGRLRAELVRTTKSKYEVAISKQPVACSQSGCSLKESLRGIGQYFLTGVGPVAGATEGPLVVASPAVADKREKALASNAIVRDDLEAAEQVSDLDSFLSQLDSDIPPNPDLGRDAHPTTPVYNAPGAPPVLLTTDQSALDNMAVGMSEPQVQEQLLLEFPGGPPGADVLCLK